MRASTAIRGLLLLATAMSLALQPLGAVASPRRDDPLTPNPTYTMPLSYSTTLTAVGEGGHASSGLPIPIGMTPVTLSGRITATTVSDGIAIVSVGTAQTTVAVRAGGTFVLDLPPDTMVNSLVAVTLANSLNPKNDEKCSYDTTSTVTLSDVAIVATGVETPPATVAEFFSPSVRSITVASPQISNAAVNEAALTAVGSLAARYGRDTSIVALTASQYVAKPGPGVRTVLLNPTNDPTVTLSVTNTDVPTLTLSGPANLLSAAAATLGTAPLGLAGAPVVTDLAQSGGASVNKSLTLADLGTAQPTLAGIGRVTYTTTISQSRFGGPMSSFSLHLEGGHTANPPEGIETITVLWNDVIVNSQSIGNTDTYVVDEEIGSSLVKRDNTLTVRLEAIPPGGYCSATPLPAELTLNGTGSTVIGHPGQSLPAGFQRFPQTLGTALPVAFGSGGVTPEMLTSAAHIVSTLQRAAAPQLAIRVVDFATFAAASYPGVVVGASPKDADTLKAPLRFAPWRAVSTAGTGFTVTVDGPFAALEGYSVGGRDVVLAGSTTPESESGALAATLANSVDANPFGWFVFTGDLLVAQPALPILSLATATIVPQTQATQEFTVPLWIVIALGVIILIAVARIISLSRRRRRIKNDVPE